MLIGAATTSMCQTAPGETDELARWFCGFIVAAKSFLRSEKIPPEQLAGILSREEIQRVEATATHTPLYCARMMRAAIARGLLLEESGERCAGTGGNGNGGAGVSIHSSAAPAPAARGAGDGGNGAGSGSEGGGGCGDETPALDDFLPRRRRLLHPQHSAAVMSGLERHVDDLVNLCGAMERIRSTRLPIVYVSHLRTFLVGYLLSLPFVYVAYWGWGTIPAVAAVSFAMLGIEGAATECENPFSAKRTNHLAMDRFCEAQVGEVCQLLRWWRDEEDEEHTTAK